jgi:hypothetical protein
MNLRKVSLVAGCAATVVLMIGVGLAAADTVTINASTDVWIREYVPNTTVEDDWVSVAGPDVLVGDNNLRRYGLLEFDVGSVTVPIMAAHLELYAMHYTANSCSLNQQAGLLTPDDIASTTWSNLWTTKTEIGLQGLGYMTLAANSADNMWYASNSATTADLAHLNDLRLTSGKVTMLLAASAGRHEWGDEYAGFAPRLVLTTNIPEPGTVVLLGMGIVSLLAYAWRKRK